MRISEIIVYSYYGQQRRIQFSLNGLNIITGESKSGKSAIIHILDYCLGSKNCHVPLGIIREKVSWYAVRLILDRGELFVARKNPDAGKKTSHEIFLDAQSGAYPESNKSLEANSNLDGLRKVLSSAVGIDENLHVPIEGQTRDPLEANFRHSIIYSFQDQSLIDNKNQLFYSQNESFVELAIRDTLPYFLGAVDQDELLNQNRLGNLKKRLKQIEKQLEIAVGWQDVSIDRAQAFLAEARQVRLIGPEQRPVSPGTVFNLLASIPSMTLDDPEFVEMDDELEKLEDIRDGLRNEYFAVGKRIDDALSLSLSRKEYGRELLEQRARLSLLPESDDETVVCPLCHKVDEASHELLHLLSGEILEVSSRMAELQVHGPRLQAYISRLESRRAELREQISNSQSQINNILAQAEQLREIRNLQARRARVQGRISAFLEQQSSSDDRDELELKAEELRRSIAQIESNIDGDNFAARLRNAEANLERLMTEYARELRLEHSDGQTRLDTRQLTVVSETRYGSIPLEDMGSGDNWVGVHVISHMALHNWFRAKDRPVPAFVVFDQPSKAHYPPEIDDLSDVGDDDRQSVVRLFHFMYEKSHMDSPFQTIVLDHADEKEAWFQESVIERWRDGEKLVPEDWQSR
jgi:tetrahydromethanopterin S-methyltransferase subunit G